MLGFSADVSEGIKSPWQRPGQPNSQLVRCMSLTRSAGPDILDWTGSDLSTHWHGTIQSGSSAYGSSGSYICGLFSHTVPLDPPPPPIADWHEWQHFYYITILCSTTLFSERRSSYWPCLTLSSSQPHYQAYYAAAVIFFTPAYSLSILPRWVTTRSPVEVKKAILQNEEATISWLNLVRRAFSILWQLLVGNTGNAQKRRRVPSDWGRRASAVLCRGSTGAPQGLGAC